jgi:hypothetical protein
MRTGSANYYRKEHPVGLDLCQDPGIPLKFKKSGALFEEIIVPGPEFDLFVSL